MSPSDELRADNRTPQAGDAGIAARSSQEGASHYEAVEAIEHHRHHPGDPNADVVRGALGRHAVLAAALSAAVTIAGVVALALAVGSR